MHNVEQEKLQLVALLDKTKEKLAEYDNTLQATESSLSHASAHGAKPAPADKIGKLRRQSTMLQSKLLQKQAGAASKQVRKATTLRLRLIVQVVCLPVHWRCWTAVDHAEL